MMFTCYNLIHELLTDIFSTPKKHLSALPQSPVEVLGATAYVSCDSAENTAGSVQFIAKRRRINAITMHGRRWQIVKVGNLKALLQVRSEIVIYVIIVSWLWIMSPELIEYWHGEGYPRWHGELVVVFLVLYSGRAGDFGLGIVQD